MSTVDDALLADLTDAQRQAVIHRRGALLVLAGPGSGKTTVVTRRVAALIAQGVPGYRILALTFTNKAATEMRERISALVGLPGRGGPTVATFHSFCARQLRLDAEAAGLARRYSIYDDADRRDALKRAIAEVGLSAQNWAPASVAAAISRAKNRLLDAAAYAADAGDFYSRCIARIYQAYEKILAANDALDFDDLLLRAAALLRQSAPVRTTLQERYQYLLIDEYQDTNHAQFVIAHTLAAAHGNICVVGDPDQSIYGWRGADLTNILEFEEHYPEAVIVPLGQNFRSTGHIVETAAGLIRNNRRRKHKHLYTELGEGERPTVVVCRDEHHEASLVADYLRLAFDENGVPWKEMAVLYRINALSRVLEDAMRDGQIPYVIARGTAFYERKEVKDALAYLRLVANTRDEVSLRRIVNKPARGIGKTTLQKIEIFAIDKQLRLFDALGRAHEVRDLGPRAVKSISGFVRLIETVRAEGAGPLDAGDSAGLARLVERIIRESGLEAMYRGVGSEDEHQRPENLDELISAAAQFAPPASEDPWQPTLLDGLTAFLESVALVSDADRIDPERGTVTLMTLHAAKGLGQVARAAGHCRSRVEQHRARHPSAPLCSRRGRGCGPACDAVLQQALAGGNVSPFHGRGRFVRPARGHVQHPGPNMRRSFGRHHRAAGGPSQHPGDQGSDRFAGSSKRDRAADGPGTVERRRYADPADGVGRRCRRGLGGLQSGSPEGCGPVSRVPGR